MTLPDASLPTDVHAHDAFETDAVEAEREHGVRGLGRVAAAASTARASRQPISTAGMISGRKSGTARPANPISSPRARELQREQPEAAFVATSARTSASCSAHSARVRVEPSPM